MLRTAPGRVATLALACAALLAVGAGSASAAAWLPAQDLSAPLRVANNVRVAMDGGGDVAAVWQRPEDKGTAPIVQAAIRPPGGAFSSPVDLAKNGQQPQVAMSQAGETIVAWWQFRQTGGETPAGFYALWVSARPPGGGFSPPVEIVELEHNAGSPPEIQLAVNDAGDAVLAWMRRVPKTPPEVEPRTIEASTRPAGGAFSAAEAISEDGDRVAEPHAAIDASGNVVAVWSVAEPVGELVEVTPEIAFGDVGSGFDSPPQQLPTEDELGFAAEAGISAAGIVTVVWEAADNEEDGEGKPLPPTSSAIKTVSGPLGGPFSSPASLSGGASTFADQPTLAVNASGAAVAAWHETDGGGNEAVRASVRSAGGSFPGPGGAVDLSNPAGGDASFPDVAMNDAGASVAVWHQGSPGVVHASVRGPGGPFGPPAPISTPGGMSLFGDVAIGPTGDAVAVWKRETKPTEAFAQAAGYDANPPVFRGLSIPSHGTVGVPVAFSADPFDLWGIAATTFAFGDGAGAAGASVAHAYGAPGVYPVTVTTTDTAGNLVSAGGTISISARPGTLRIGKRKKNRRKGTILLTVRVSGPGQVVLAGKGVRRQQKRARRAGPVKLLVRAKGKFLKRLNRTGKARVRATVSFRPADGGAAARRSFVLVLVKK